MRVVSQHAFPALLGAEDSAAMGPVLALPSRGSGAVWGGQRRLPGRGDF